MLEILIILVILISVILISGIVLWGIIVFVVIISNLDSIKMRNSRETIPEKSMWSYAQDINRYMHNHKSKDFLENQNCKAMINNFDQGFVIRVQNKKNLNEAFEIYSIIPVGKDQLIATLWSIMQVYFNPNITYSGLLFWVQNLENYHSQHSIEIRRL